MTRVQAGRSTPPWQQGSKVMWRLPGRSHMNTLHPIARASASCSLAPSPARHAAFFLALNQSREGGSVKRTARRGHPCPPGAARHAQVRSPSLGHGLHTHLHLACLVACASNPPAVSGLGKDHQLWLRCKACQCSEQGSDPNATRGPHHEAVGQGGRHDS